MKMRTQQHPLQESSKSVQDGFGALRFHPLCPSPHTALVSQDLRRWPLHFQYRSCYIKSAIWKVRFTKITTHCTWMKTIGFETERPEVAYEPVCKHNICGF